jgi:enterochelin esterase-like enzyme
MQRVEGTDLFYYVSRLEPDARVNYRFVRNFDEMIADPLNPRTTADRRGNKLSWFGMPGWQEPSHIQEPPQSKRGRFESLEIKSTKKPIALAKVDVYLPAGYDSLKDAYPVLYILDGKLAKENGAIHNSMENLNGTLLQPVILVFLTEIKTNDAERTTNIQQTKETSAYFAEEIVPFIDGKYRTLKDRQNRALAGTLEGAGDAFYIAFENPNLFGAIAAQSMWVMDVEKELKPLITSPQEKPMRIYMDWGSYDARSKSDGWDLRESNRNFLAFLKEKGYMPSGGETHEGYGWASWRNRNDRVLASLFPRM